MMAATIGIPSSALEAQRHYGYPDLAFIHPIAASPGAIAWLQGVAIASAACFTVGLVTRSAYGVFVATMFIATFVTLERRSAHDLGLPLIALIGWLTVRWGDGLSVDRLVARVRAREHPPSGLNAAYGFALWWPGLALGLALLAAAYTKMERSEWQWVSTGAVRYHFVMDASSARVDWGLWIASHYWAAVLVSLAAALTEAGMVLVALTARPSLRFLAFLAGAGLFTGLYLLQGIYWWGWLLLLLAFLPWQWLDRRDRTIASARITKPQMAVAVTMVVLQLSASIVAVDYEPLFSNFPMYSKTFASPEAFDREMAWRLTRITEVHDDAGTNVEPVVRELRDDDRATLLYLAESPLSLERMVDDEPDAIARLCASVDAAMPSIPTRIRLGVEREGFDWNQGRFFDFRPITVRDIPLRDVCAARAAFTP